MTAERVSPQGIIEIASKEGIVPAPYWCSAGVLTFGVGHTAAAGFPDPARMPRVFPQTDAEFRQAVRDAINIFRDDLVRYESRVRRATEGVKLEQHQFDALVSWDINTGGSLWRHPTSRKPAQIIQQIHRGDFSGEGLMGWLRPPELRGRRELELALFRDGTYTATSVPIWRTDGNYRLRGIHSTMSGEELLKKLGVTAGAPEVNLEPKELSWLARVLVRLFGGAV